MIYTLNDLDKHRESAYLRYRLENDGDESSEIAQFIKDPLDYIDRYSINTTDTIATICYSSGNYSEDWLHTIRFTDDDYGIICKYFKPSLPQLNSKMLQHMVEKKYTL